MDAGSSGSQLQLGSPSVLGSASWAQLGPAGLEQVCERLPRALPGVQGGTRCPLTATCLDISSELCQLGRRGFHSCLCPSHPHPGSSRSLSPWGRAVLTLMHNLCSGKGATGCPSSKAISSREDPLGCPPSPRNDKVWMRWARLLNAACQVVFISESWKDLGWKGP